MSNLGKLTIAITANTKGLESAAKKTRSILGSLGRAATSLPGLLGAAATGAAVTGLVKTADAYTLMAAQLEYLTGSAWAAEEAQQQLFDMSQETQSSMIDNATALVKLGQAQELMGTTTEENIGIIGSLNRLFLQTGVSSDNAGSALLQLTQALGSGRLAGDELKSLFENAPALVKVFADSMGVGIGEMKKLGSEGLITTEAMTTALRDMGESAGQTMGELPKTFSGAWQQVVTSFGDAWDQINDQTGIMSYIVGSVKDFAAWITENKGVWTDWVWELVEGLRGGALQESIASFQNTLSTLWTNISSQTGTMEDFFAKLISGLNDTIRVMEGLVQTFDWFVQRWENFTATQRSFNAWMAEGSKQLVFKGGETPQRTSGEIISGAAGATVNNFFNAPQTKNEVLDITTQQTRQAAQI